MTRVLTLIASSVIAGCAALPNSDPLTIDVAGIEPLPSEGLELRLAVTVRIQNPNDAPVEYTGAALSLDLNGRNLASGVTPAVGAVPRYGETTFTVPMTISAFDMMRQVLGFIEADARGEVRYRVRGKLEGGLFGSRRFTDEGTMVLRRDYRKRLIANPEDLTPDCLSLLRAAWRCSSQFSRSETSSS